MYTNFPNQLFWHILVHKELENEVNSQNIVWREWKSSWMDGPGDEEQRPNYVHGLELSTTNFIPF